MASPSLGAMSPALESRVAAAGPTDRLAVIATLRDQVDGARFDGHPTALLRALRSTAARTQSDVVEDVDHPVRRFWLVNAVSFAGTPEEIRDVAADPAVDTVDADVRVRVADASGTAAATPFPDAGGGDWGAGGHQGADGVERLRPARRRGHHRDHRHRRQREPPRPGREDRRLARLRRRQPDPHRRQRPRHPHRRDDGRRQRRRRPDRRGAGRAPDRRPRHGSRRGRRRAAPCWRPPSG